MFHPLVRPGLAVPLVAALTTVIEPERSRADGIDLPDAYTSIAAITSALSSSAADLVQLERATQRLKKIRIALATKLLAANFGDKFSINDLIDEQDLLCGVRADHISTVS